VEGHEQLAAQRTRGDAAACSEVLSAQADDTGVQPLRAVDLATRRARENTLPPAKPTFARTKRTSRWMLALALRKLLRDSAGSCRAATPPSLPVQEGAAPAAPACPGMAARRQLCAPGHPRRVSHVHSA